MAPVTGVVWAPTGITLYGEKSQPSHFEGFFAACPTKNTIIPGGPWNTGMGPESK